jgi:hypothetical protein
MKKGKIFPVHEAPLYLKERKCISTGEYREPKKGEVFISGAIPGGYIAFNNMSTKYYIAKPVK